MLSTLRSVPPSRRLVWIVALAALSGVMAILSFVAPSTIRYATLSSADANVAGGGPLVLAGEGPREMTVSIDARGVTDAGQVLFTTDSAGNEGRGLTVQVGDDGRPAVFLTSGPGQDDTQITIPDAQFSLKYSAIGGRATVDVTSQAGTETISGATLIITGVYTPSRAVVSWNMETQPSGSTPTLWGVVLWVTALLLLFTLIGLSLLGITRRRPSGALSWRVGIAAAAVWLGMALLLRANFDDGWILAQARLYEQYGWFTMYWENAALPAPTGYLWERTLSLVANLVHYQYATTRILVSATAWFAAWYFIDRTLRALSAPKAARIVAFATLAAVGGGIGMNVRPEAFTALLAACVLLLASAPRTPYGTRGVLAGVLGGLAIGSHPAGWVVALPAVAIMARDARGLQRLGGQLLVFLSGLAAAGATLATVVTIDSSASVAVPVVDFLSAGRLQGKTPFDELARINDLAGFSPNFRMGLALLLIALALMVGWWLQPEGVANGFIVLCAALSVSGLALTTSKWAAHTAAIAPAVALVCGLAWPIVARSRARVLAALVGLVTVVLWSFRGDVTLGAEYGGHVSSLPGDQLFTSAATAWHLALVLLALCLGLVLLAVLLPVRRAVLAGAAAGWIILVPTLAVAATSAVELYRTGTGWSLTAQHLRPGGDCGAAKDLPVFLDASGSLADPTGLPLKPATRRSAETVDIGPGDTEVAVWTSNSAPSDTRILLDSRTGTVPFARHPSVGADFALWTAPVDASDQGRGRIVVSRGSGFQWAPPISGRVTAWGDHAADVQILGTPFLFLQIPCTSPVPLPLDTVTEPVPLVWSGDIQEGPAWWLPVRLAGVNPTFELSPADGPVGLNVSMMGPTDLAKAIEPAACRSGWLSLNLSSCSGR